MLRAQALSRSVCALGLSGKVTPVFAGAAGVGLLWCLLLLAPAGLPSQELPSPSARRADLCLPGDPQGPEIVSPYATDLPAACAAFLERIGATPDDWFIAWDRALETPRLAFPARPFALPAGPSGPSLKAVAESVLAFVAAHPDFLGVGPEDLVLPEVHALGDGYLFTAYQAHQGMAVRGSAFRVRLNGDFSLRSLSCRLARDLPPLAPAALGEEEISALAAAAFQEELRRTLQVAFPGDGPASAACAWGVVGVDARGEEVEKLYAATSGEETASRSMTLHIDLPIAGSVRGFSPPPDDVFSMPFQFSENDIYALPDLSVDALDGAPLGRARATGLSGADGSFAMTLTGVLPGLGYIIFFRLAVHERFAIEKGSREMTPFLARFDDTARADIVLNAARLEFDAFNLMTFHHFRRAERIVGDLAIRHGLLEYLTASPMRLELSNQTYEHSYQPVRKIVRIASDEVLPLEPGGRYRKVVPTILYHEFGHHIIEALTGDFEESQVNEGVSDALSTFLARVSTLGFVDLTTPNADPAARDLRGDVTAYPQEPRRTVSGALWELWEATLDRSEDQQPLVQRRSSFASGLLLRWLASKRIPGAQYMALPLEFSPLLGVEFFVEADDPLFDGNNYLPDGIPHQPELVQAFGMRNMFPLAFIRGDANGSASVDISDALKVFGHLFLGDDVGCPDALDTNDSGGVDIADGIYLLFHLFAGGAPLRVPYPGCGWDLTTRDGLGCWSSPCGFFPERR